MRITLVPALLAGAGILGFSAAGSDDKLFEVSKNLEIFSSIYQRLNSSYVDEPRPGELMKTGIDAMLRSLDPYTVYYSEEDIEDYRYQSTGQYGGIGATIRKMSGSNVVTEVYEGFAAMKAGIKPGDVIVEVNGLSTTGKNGEVVMKQLRGVPNTSISLKVKRPGASSPLDFTFSREEIKPKTVAYSTVLANNTGYIKLNEFGETAASEVREALLDLKQKNITTLVLDLRGNPGGLVNQAVAIVNLFVDKGNLVLKMRGRIAEQDQTYRTELTPVDTQIPLAVLTDGGSASASEIVAGALQDLDRAVIVGQRSYGKGLVQNTVPVAYGAFFKLTIAKYYTPSGRCVQALDYSHRNADGSVVRVPDSLITEFKTRNGRTVWDGLGVIPDMEVPARKYSVLTDTLLAKGLIFDYATEYALAHSNLEGNEAFRFSADEYAKFVAWVKKRDYSYLTPEEKSLEQFRKSAEKSGNFNGMSAEFQALKTKAGENKKDDFEEFRTEITVLLEAEISSRYYYEKGRIASSLKDDPDLNKAMQILADKKAYTDILTVVKKLPKPQQRTDMEKKDD
ncbi:MAG: S41 family peptidase [Bacteroidetes bacterium]|nr:S41 family peptidase [Bacteroidota bacterium]